MTIDPAVLREVMRDLAQRRRTVTPAMRERNRNASRTFWSDNPPGSEGRAAWLAKLRQGRKNSLK